MRLALPAFALLVVASIGARGAGLPDTGLTACFNGMTMVACTPALLDDTGFFPRQDARFGRDAKVASGLFTKVGAGSAGFDYTKVANDGTDLPAGATLGPNPTDWACTRDNVTGLLWEVKAAAPHLRQSNFTYTWFSADGATNGGDPGVPDTVGIGSDNCFDATRCDTEKFIADVNAGAGLCGQTDWRLPSRRELRTIAHLGG